MKALSLDLRQRIAAALRRGQNRKDIAARFDVCEASVYRIQLLDRKGDLTAKKQPGRPPAFSPEELKELDTLVQEQRQAGEEPDGRSLVEQWQAKSGKRVGLSTLYRGLHAAGLSFKKSASSRPSEMKSSVLPSETP